MSEPAAEWAVQGPAAAAAAERYRKRKRKRERRVHSALQALLKRLEWSGSGRPYDTGGREPICPICFQSRWSNTHLDDCELAKLIAVLEEESNE